MRYLKHTDKDSKPVLSIHIPKTAGTSISSALTAQGFVELPFVEKYSWRNLQCKVKKINRPSKHAKAKAVRLALGDKAWDEYFTFAIVRNPWDLMVSSYNWWLQKGHKWEKLHPDVEAVRQMNFSEFIQSRYGRRMINEQYGSLRDWICDETGTVIVSFVGKFENLAEDWGYICQSLALADAELPHANKTARSDYRDYYDQHSRQIIESRFEWTIQQFGYRF